MVNKYKNITMYELNLMFLESKYQQVAYSTYGSYQNKAKIINEYLGDIKVKDIDDSKIENFYKHIKNDKIWNYSKNISSRTVKNIMYYLYTLLNKAKFWNIIPINPLETNFNIDKKDEEKSHLFVKERHKLLLDIENRRISVKMSEILDI